ncbi:ABC transporter permease [Plantibacter sp. YIM 135249]|jgi:putative ABC transport system permease protein|uniref:ABC transporter permease n=1 Tax=Plantibacter sp. YIM 135249 TaxID=3423918 RepID=UPI003D33A6D7
MKTLDVLGRAVANTFRSRTRTILTILAIFVGAFTLTITQGLGTGINQYIDQTVGAIGATDVLTVTKTADTTTTTTDGPREYDPDTVTSGGAGPGGQRTVALITPTDLDALAAVTGVDSVQPTKSVKADFIQHDDGGKYVIGIGAFVQGQKLQLASGSQPDASSDLQVAIPANAVTSLGLGSDAKAIGQTVSIQVTDASKATHLVDATVIGVAEQGVGAAGTNAVPNDALMDALYAAQSTGLTQAESESYAQASVRFDPSMSASQVTALQDRLTDAGFTSTTVAQQLGTFKTVIDAIVTVLNAFAVIALLAASFGIINTLFMSVQERTREIGLMKAMGMSSGKVFGLFSYEALFIGFLGSAIGTGLGMLIGSVVGNVLSTRLFADLPGLQLIAFTPASILTIIGVVMLLAFAAGTLPAARAARQNPVESLRYE